MSPTLLSIVIAAVIGLAYVGAVWLTYLLAHRADGKSFLGIVLGGTLLRLVGMLVVVGGVLAFVPVEAMPFALTLAGVLILGLGLDALLMFRRMKPTAS